MAEIAAVNAACASSLFLASTAASTFFIAVFTADLIDLFLAVFVCVTKILFLADLMLANPDTDLYPIKEFIQHLKFQKLLDSYDDLYSMDMFGESIEGHKYRTPYQVVKMINPNSKEDMELLREVLRNNHFDDEDE